MKSAKLPKRWERIIKVLFLTVVLFVLFIFPGLLILLPKQYLIFFVSLILSFFWSRENYRSTFITGSPTNPVIKPTKELMETVLQIHKMKILGYTLITLGVIPIILAYFLS